MPYKRLLRIWNHWLVPYSYPGTCSTVTAIMPDAFIVQFMYIGSVVDPEWFFFRMRILLFSWFWFRIPVSLVENVCSYGQVAIKMEHFLIISQVGWQLSWIETIISKFCVCRRPTVRDLTKSRTSFRTWPSSSVPFSRYTQTPRRYHNLYIYFFTVVSSR
jgi:hypothetical protein